MSICTSPFPIWLERNPKSPHRMSFRLDLLFRTSIHLLKKLFNIRNTLHIRVKLPFSDTFSHLVVAIGSALVSHFTNTLLFSGTSTSNGSLINFGLTKGKIDD